jgi:hypothetical protein
MPTLPQSKGSGEYSLPTLMAKPFTDCLKCPMDHHDVKALEKGLLSKSRKQRRQASQEQSRSSVSTSSNHAAESGHLLASSSGASLVQSNSLLGLGQNPQLLQTFTSSTSDPQSLVGDPLAGIQAQRHTPLLADGVEFSRLFDSDPYESYQDGQMLALGVLRQYYICQHLDGLCEQNFESPEALEEHFETAHFAFDRLIPPYRYICSNCQFWHSSLSSRCQQCRADSSVEVWIYGNFVRTPFYPRFPPDGQDPFKLEISSLPEILSPYDTSANNSQLGGGHGGVTGFTGGMNQGAYNYQNHNTYPAHNSPSYGFRAYGPSPPRDSRNHGSGFMEHRNEAESKPLGILFWHFKTLHDHHRYILISILILLLVSMTVIVQSHQWLVLKMQGFQPRPFLPTIGFVAVLASYVVGYALLSAKRIRTQCVSITSYGTRSCRLTWRSDLNDVPCMTFGPFLWTARQPGLHSMCLSMKAEARLSPYDISPLRADD